MSGWWLDLMILGVFSNLNDRMIQRFYVSVPDCNKNIFDQLATLIFPRNLENFNFKSHFFRIIKKMHLLSINVFPIKVASF